ncbi:helix-turn-helix domain-containing protein [Salmonella enterica]|uniref:helix-turn-helix domain-containing protein n=1 Tax=Salmonella enterica TaxID=28901 RepID=UPI0039BF7F23
MLQGDLGIGSTELCILLNILMHQWPESGESISFPSIGTIASRIGVSKRTIQRGVSNLCNDPAVPAQLSGFGIGLRRCFHL